MKDPALVIVNGLLKSGDEAGLNSTERYDKSEHYKATLWHTADVAVASLGIEEAGEGLFRLKGLEE